MLKIYKLFIQNLHTELKKRAWFWINNPPINCHNRYSKLFKASPLPISFIRVPDRIIIDVNPAFERLFGYTRKEIIGKTSYHIGLWIDPNDWNIFYKFSFVDGRIKTKEVKLLRKNGEQITCLLTGNYFTIRKNGYLFAFYQDLTVQKQVEESLKASEVKYQDIFHSVNEAIVVYDEEAQTIVDANLVTMEMFGYSPGELKRIDPQTLKYGTIPYHFPGIKNHLFNDLNSKNVEFIEWQARGRRGKKFWVELFLRRIRLNNRKRLIISIRDISERKNTERLLLENEFLFRTQFNSSNIGIVITNTEQKVIKVNKQFCKIIDIDEATIIGMKWSDFILMGDTIQEYSLFEKLMRMEIDYFEIEKRYNRIDGSSLYAKLSVSCLRNSDGGIRYIICHVFDISDRVEMESRILKAIVQGEENEKLKFSQELHDGLGPILSAIKMQVQWLGSKNTNSECSNSLSFVEKLVHQADITMREIAFGLSPHILQNFGLLEALNHFTRKITGNQPPLITINSNFAHRLEETLETVLYRVLSECINNSIRHSQASRIEIILSLHESILEVNYADNGIGFNWEEMCNLRKGLGLSNILTRVKSVNGTFSVNTKPGEGFSVNIRIGNVKNYTG